jgi:hypothetical protein
VKWRFLSDKNTVIDSLNISFPSSKCYFPYQHVLGLSLASRVGDSYQ